MASSKSSATQSAEITNTPKVIVLDTTSGVVRGGHDTDDLNALIDALRSYRAVKLAPYEGCIPRTTNKMGRVRLLAKALRELTRRNEDCVLVVQSASRLELLALAAFTILFGRKCRLLVALRRESYGAGWVGFAFRYLISSLIRRGLWIVASYSHLVFEFWQRQSGRPGCLLAFPKRRVPPGWKKAHPGALTFGLLGAMRWDKGAAHYDGLIEKCVALGDDCRVIVQCYTQHQTASDLDLATLGRILHDRWSHHERVRVIGENLSSNDYAALLAETDIGVFPYDVVSYGGGDSGVLHEILTMGKIAVATPIAWAKSAFARHPNLIFIDDPAGDNATSALREAYRRARAMRHTDVPNGIFEDLFAESWRAALSKTISALQRL